MDRYLRVKTNIAGPPVVTQEIIPLENLQHIEYISTTEIDFDYFQQHGGGHPHVRLTLSGTGGAADVQEIIQAFQDIIATQDENPIGVFDVASVIPGVTITGWAIVF